MLGMRHATVSFTDGYYSGLRPGLQALNYGGVKQGQGKGRFHMEPTRSSSVPSARNKFLDMLSAR